MTVRIKIKTKPNLLALVKYTIEFGFAKTGRIYGVSAKTVKKWLLY